MKKISAEIVADSISEQGHRITSMLLTYPRFIHGEVMTHRMFSRNSASSRAIPFSKMVKMVEEDPFIPIAWQKDHKGMQGSECFSDTKPDGFDSVRSAVDLLKERWLRARDAAIEQAKNLHRAGSNDEVTLTKQLCNRLLEPFMWHTVLVTFTEVSNFFELRCPQYKIPIIKGDKEVSAEYFKSKKDYINECGGHESAVDWRAINESQAEIHMQALAEAMWDEMNNHYPTKLLAGEWHIPDFGDKFSGLAVWLKDQNITPYQEIIRKYSIKIATARCARLSYMTFDNEIDYEKDIKLHDQLLESKHYSPFEHCARAMNIITYNTTSRWEDKFKTSGWCNNFRGFISYRHLLERKK